MSLFNRQTKFIFAVVLQVAIILLIVGFKLAVLGSGNEVILKVIPRDPRDMLRGDYMVFEYNISRLPVYLARDTQLREGQVVYVLLRPLNSDRYWTVKAIQAEKPKRAGEIFIKGKLKEKAPEPQAFPMDFVDKPQLKVNQAWHIVYGIEEYYIPEGTGRQVSLWGKEVLAKVKVSENGQAVLEQIYINGQPWP